MKKILAAALCLSSFGVAAQKIDASKVPASVKAAFEKDFPGVKAGAWEKERGDYEVSFKKDGSSMSALIDPSGALKETERSIPVAKLPAPVPAYIEKHYKGSKIIDAAEITTPDGTITYEAHIKKADVIFDNSGKFLRTQKD